MMRFSSFIIVYLVCELACAQEFKDVAPFLGKVQADSIRAHIKYLASDQLKGRLPNTPEYQMAMNYVISRYKAMGLEPAGENQSYLQTVKFRKARVNKDGTHVVLQKGGSSKDLVFGDEYAVTPNFEERGVEADGSLVFVGYGISEPDFGYDDYAGVDVKGKIVVMVNGAPDKFPSTVKAHVMNRTTRVKTALQKGAIGVIVRAPGLSIQNIVQASVKTGSEVALGNMIKGVKLSGVFSQPFFNSLLNITEEEASKMFLSLKEGKPNSFELNASLKVVLESTYEDFESYNIVGLIRGNDKILKDEYVIYSAHMDHLGIGTPVKGDSIYNGAHDNASGVACVMEVARVFSSLKQKPKRSIIIITLVGEEMGLLGSSYFASHPTVPKDKIVVDVNMDMPTLFPPLHAMVPLGAMHSSLMNPVVTASNYLKIGIEEDPEPEQNRFTRSDQYSFVQEGIPALNIRYVDAKSDGTQKVKAWRAAFYHQPQDEYSEENFDFELGKKYVQLCFLIGYQVAQDKKRPTWNKDDFFGKKFGGVK